MIYIYNGQTYYIKDKSMAYIATDLDGTVYAFDRMPVIYGAIFAHACDVVSGEWLGKADLCPDWRDSLRKISHLTRVRLKNDMRERNGKITWREAAE